MTGGGGTGSVDFGSGMSISAPGRADVYAWKINGGTGATVWARGAAGTTEKVNQGMGIAVNSAGTAVALTGYLGAATNFGPGGVIVPVGVRDAFVARLDGTGQFVWAKPLAMSASSGASQGDRVAIDGLDRVITTGVFAGTIDLNPGAGTRLGTSQGPADAYIVALDASGIFAYGTTFGGRDSRKGPTSGRMRRATSTPSAAMSARSISTRPASTPEIPTS